MDLRTVVTIATLLIMNAESEQSTQQPPPTDASSPAPANSTKKDCVCSSAAPANTIAPTSPKSPAPVLGLLRIRWSKCKGDVNLILYHPSNSSLPVCHDSKTIVQSLLRDVCQNRKGCKGTPSWEKSREQLEGRNIREDGQAEETRCEILRVQCKVEALENVQGQLQSYKVVTALLCCVLLVLLLIRFTRPTVKALQKRLSDRRQNRWIGPTQSHSVSYHRGKTAVKNNDGEKRSSYPALERLAVSDSREPSSNRNSDYNF